jgi:FdhD protein
MSGRTARTRVVRIVVPEAREASTVPEAREASTVAAEQVTERAEVLAAEEPLGIRIGGEPVALTMRTPGDDIDLTAGFLFSEGIVESADDIVSIALCDGTSCGHAGHDGIGNIAEVQLRPGMSAALVPRRNFLISSACGVCGRSTSEQLFVRPAWDIRQDRTSFPATMVAALPAALRQAQRVFASTGGLHAAGVFGSGGELLAAREDVGRHNAVDKVVGWALRDGRLPLRGCVLLVSGRASFELVSKAARAGFPVLAAVSAPSSLAVGLAAEAGLTLAGFVRDGAMNVYSGAARISLPGQQQPTAAPDGQVDLGEDQVDHDADHHDHDHDRDRS